MAKRRRCMRRKKKKELHSLIWQIYCNNFCNFLYRQRSARLFLHFSWYCCQSKGILEFLLIGFWCCCNDNLWSLVGWFVCVAGGEPAADRRNAIYDGFLLVHWPLLARRNHQHKMAKKRILQRTIKCTLYCVSIFHNHRWMVGFYFLLTLLVAMGSIIII